MTKTRRARPRPRSREGLAQGWLAEDAAPTAATVPYASQPWADPTLSSPDEVDVRALLPHQARKVYTCPGCQQLIPRGTAHVVVVPKRDPGLRRHWHTSCWHLRDRRRPGN